MSYKLIVKSSRQNKVLHISERYISFTKWFKDNNIIKRYVLFYVNDDGFLCLKFMDDYVEGAYCITYRDTTKSYLLACPRPLLPLINKGQYDVKEKDGYYITNCKLNLKDNQ